MREPKDGNGLVLAGRNRAAIAFAVACAAVVALLALTMQPDFAFAAEEAAEEGSVTDKLGRLVMTIVIAIVCALAVLWGASRRR